MLKYNQGVVLIEMLVSVVVVGSIVLLILNLMLLISSAVSYDQLISKIQQTTSLMTTDFYQATNIESNGNCLTINQKNDVVDYCINQDLTRTVNGSGYERLISNVEARYVDDGIIYLEVKVSGNELKVPIWSSNE